MNFVTFEQIAERVAAHAETEARRNAPIVVGLHALNTLRTALAEMSADERSDIRVEVDALSSELDEGAWQSFATTAR